MTDVTCVLPKSLTWESKGTGLECILQLPFPGGYCLPSRVVVWGGTRADETTDC